MTERIFLTYTNATAVPYQGSVLGHHIVLNYVDSDGKHYTLQGMPEHKFDHNAAKLIAFIREEGLSDGANNRDSPFQRLRAKKDKDFDPALGRPSTLIAEGDDLRSQWARMTDFGDEVNSTGYEYRPYSQNSNSFASEALKRAGFFGPGTAFPEIFDRLLAVDPGSGETRAVRVPGFDQRLMNPLGDPATPSNRSEIPFVPANVFSAGGRQNTFDNRFEGWVTSPPASVPAKPDLPAWAIDTAGNRDVADSKPVRYLSRRAAGRPEASALDTGTSAVPFVPSGEGITSEPRNSFDGRFGNWTSSPAGIMPRNPNLPLPPPEPGRPLGMFAGKPMPIWVTPPPMQKSSNEFGAPGSGSSIPLGGLAGRIAALAGIDPDNPDQPAPPPGGLLKLLLGLTR